MFKPVVSRDRTGRQGVINLCLQHEVEDTLDTAVVSVCRQTLLLDGARDGMQGYGYGIHVIENLPCDIHTFREDASV